MNTNRAEYRQLPQELQTGLTWRLLKYFGSGAIVACITIDSGETVFASRGGAIYGYTLLWCFLYRCLSQGNAGLQRFTVYHTDGTQSPAELEGTSRIARLVCRVRDRLQLSVDAVLAGGCAWHAGRILELDCGDPESGTGRRLFRVQCRGTILWAGAVRILRPMLGQHSISLLE